MHKEYPDEGLPDNSPTDELPVLSELDVVEDFDATALFRGVDEDEDTGTHSILTLEAETAAEDPAGDAPDAAVADRDATIASLAERLEATRQAIGRRDETERQLRAELAERETAERQLRAELAERETAECQLRAELAERETAAQRLRAELADSESAETRLRARVAELEAREQALEARLAQREAGAAALEARLTEREKALEAGEERLGDRDARLAEQHARRLEGEARIAALEAKLAERDVAPAKAPADESPAAPTAARPSVELREALEARAALASYIENRRAHWHEMEARVAEQQARIGELELELAQRGARQQEAVRVAELESRRVGELKEEVAKLRRLLEVRRDHPGRYGPSSGDTEAGPATAAGGPSAPAPVQPERRGSDGPADAVLADLQAQIESLEVGLTARDAALADGDAKLRTHAEQRDRLRQQLAESSARLDQSRNALRRLERVLADRDHALDVKNARIEALEAEMANTLVAPLAGATLPRLPNAVPAAARPPSEGFAGPSLVCLTSDTPRTYPLAKAAVTIGRSSQCDIQIPTHFVSREHARLTVDGDTIVIEDLGSKNGVFVNAVRVEREALSPGDLVTVGETQFRFLAP